MASIRDLSPELYLMIRSHLNALDGTCLKLTNSYFYNNIPKPSPMQFREDFQRFDGWKLYICDFCERARPLMKYAESQFSRTPHFCIECGIKKGKNGYRPGDAFVVQQRLHLGKISLLQDQYQVICTVCETSGLMTSTECPAVCEECSKKPMRVTLRHRYEVGGLTRSKPDTKAAALAPHGEVKSLDCYDCSRGFASLADAEFHAFTSGHIHFEESTKKVAALTEEEKILKPKYVSWPPPWN